MTVPVTSKQAYVCGDCIYWAPYPALPKLGTCSNVASSNYDRACIYSQDPCRDFVLRPLESEKIFRDETEFYWCEECREYFHRAFERVHSGHKIHSKVAQTDVEFNLEETHAAD
jgi:hypothetical protein